MRAGISGSIDLSNFQLLDNYYLSPAEQGSQEWKNYRFDLLTASKITSAIGDSQFTTPEKVAHNLKSKIDVEDNEAMKFGREMEPIAREIYMQKNDVTVTVPGLAIPVWDLRLGSSLDGIINKDLIMEIKCPKKMYTPLRDYTENGGDGYNHIWRSHYDQMQTCMAVYEAKNCDYVVLDAEGDLFIQRIPFDPLYWDMLYGKVCIFFDIYFNDYKDNSPKKIKKWK